MEILFLTGNLPYPPTDGWKIRVFAFLRHLSQRHRVSLVSFMRTTEDARAVEPLRRYCADVRVVLRDPRYSLWKLCLGLIGPSAFPVLNYRDNRMAEAVRSILAERPFHVVQAESLDMAQYCLSSPYPTILDLHNIESLLIQRYAEHERHLLKRLYAHITWRKLAAYERQVCGQFGHCLTCSEVDQELLRLHTGIKHVRVIPNGVALEAFEPDNTPSSEATRLVFVGRMDYHANVDGVQWFCREVLPLIRLYCPQVQLQIVGGHPTAEVKRLERPGQVEVTGFVEDVRPYLRAAAVVVVPLRVGGGTRLKILEAMAMEKAVVSTTVGAEGIPAVSGREILLADAPQEFATCVLAVMHDADLRRQLAGAARQLIASRYGWDRLVESLEEVYEKVVDGKENPAPFGKGAIA